MSKFQKGDRVRLNKAAIYWNVRYPDRLGTVQRVGNDFVAVLWNGRKTEERYYLQFIEKAD